jgi:hypothetical protein
VGFDPALGVSCFTRSPRDERVSALGTALGYAQPGDLSPGAFVARGDIAHLTQRIAAGTRCA